MKFFLLAVVVLALATHLLAQNVTPPPQATTDCGKAAQACYKDQTSNTDEKLNNNDIAGACQTYKTMTDCFNTAAAGPKCKNGGDAEFKAFKAAADDEVAGICDGSGGVTDCGYDMRKCIGYVKQIKDAFRDENKTTVCPVIDEFDTCTKGIIGAGECPKKYTPALQRAAATFAEDDELDNCKGKCGQAAGKCTEDFLKASAVDPKDFDGKKFCTTAYSAIDCIQRLSSNADCQAESTEVQQADQLVGGFKTYIGDFCDAEGNPSPCINELEACTENLKAIKKTDSVDKQCTNIAKYLECTYGLSCFASLKTKLEAERANLESVETSHQCPTYGSCSDRITVCGEKESQINELSDKKQKCKLTKEGMTCYDNVRKDSICIKEKIAVSNIETKFNNILDKQCGNVDGGISLTKHSIFIPMDISQYIVEERLRIAGEYFELKSVTRTLQKFTIVKVLVDFLGNSSVCCLTVSVVMVILGDLD